MQIRTVSSDYYVYGVEKFSVRHYHISVFAPFKAYSEWVRYRTGRRLPAGEVFCVNAFWLNLFPNKEANHIETC